MVAIHQTLAAHAAVCGAAAEASPGNLAEMQNARLPQAYWPSLHSDKTPKLWFVWELQFEKVLGRAYLCRVQVHTKIRGHFHTKAGISCLLIKHVCVFACLFALKSLFLSNLFTQCGARTQKPKIKELHALPAELAKHPTAFYQYFSVSPAPDLNYLFSISFHPLNHTPPFLSVEKILGFHIIKLAKIKSCWRECGEMGPVLKNITAFLFVYIFSFGNYHFSSSVFHFHIYPNAYHSLYFSDNFPFTLLSNFCFTYTIYNFFSWSAYHFSVF